MEALMIHLEELSYQPGQLLIFAIGTFAVVALVGGLITYIVACIVNLTTKMGGLMKVSVDLNVWPEDTAEADCPRLSYGTFLICMQDPSEIIEDRLDPKPTLLTAAVCRRYAVSRLLQRFTAALEGAGFREDPSCRLLQRLLDIPDFCSSLGVVFRRNAKKGLQAWTVLSKKEESNPGKLAVYHKVPEALGEDFCAATGCRVKMICITMEYGESRGKR